MEQGLAGLNLPAPVAAISPEQGKARSQAKCKVFDP
jgi:hypothetical protein